MGGGFVGGRWIRCCTSGVWLTVVCGSLAGSKGAGTKISGREVGC